MYRSYSQIVRPKKVKSEYMNEDEGFGSFIIQPIQRGFGTTLGNSLRRVLLSSIRGTVISVVNIEGVEHEFCNIPSVRQDVVRICLNLKKVVIKSEKEECEALLEVKGPMSVNAGMIQMPEGVEVMNKDLHLFDIESDVVIKMKLKIQSGVGHIFKELDSKDQSIGNINLDCHFSPVKKVSFEVGNTRVDKYTDYDSLKLSIQTDKSIKPDDALGIAAGVLRDMLEVCVNFDASRVLIESEEQKQSDDVGYNLNLLRRTEDLELSVRASNCFANASIKYIGDLVQKTEAEMLKMNNFGRKSLEEIRSCLSQMGLNFGMDIGEWPPKDMKRLLGMAKKSFGD